jgi:dihydroorotate dehydrogenase (fumarate)
MADLSIKYMGLDLKNPIIIGSSGLTNSVSDIVELEKNGAGAVVLKSLFEEQILMDVDSERVNNMFDSFTDTENYISFYTKKHKIEEYLNLIRDSKTKTTIPIIASINCISAHEWTDFATRIEEAGADALELNAFILPSDPEILGCELEKIYFDIVEKVKEKVNIPVSLKMSFYFSGMANFVSELSKTGIGSLVLFNRFYNPDIDLDNLKITSSHVFSSPEENAKVLRWVGILSGKSSCDIAATTGIHDGKTVLKNILVGAKAVQIATIVYQEGPEVIQKMLKEMNDWLDNKGYKSINEIVGLLKQSDLTKPMIYERAQFMKYFADAR